MIRNCGVRATWLQSGDGGYRFEGTPFHGIPGPFAKAERAHLAELSTVAAEERARALLDLDTVDTALTDELTQLVRLQL